MIRKNSNPRTTRDREDARRRLIWVLAMVFSVGLHCFLAIMVTPRGGQEEVPDSQKKVFEVTLLQPEPVKTAASESGNTELRDSGEEAVAYPPKGRPAGKRASDRAAAGKTREVVEGAASPVAGVKAGTGVEVPPSGGRGNSSKIDIWPTRDTLARIAVADPRVPHIIAEKEPPLVPEKYVKDNLPPQLRPREIELKLDGFWNPTWEQVRDEGVTGYSTRKFGGMLKDWLTSWQTAVARAGEGGYDPTRLEGLETSATIVTLVEFLPGQDGNWTARLLNRSGYRTYDSKILEDAERVALTLPRWNEGSGWALRFKFETKFMIVPPAPMLALSFDYVPPFNPEVIYPLKKMLKKAISFEGATRLEGAKNP